MTKYSYEELKRLSDSGFIKYKNGIPKIETEQTKKKNKYSILIEKKLEKLITKIFFNEK